jgi:hypothetical protein
MSVKPSFGRTNHITRIIRHQRGARKRKERERERKRERREREREKERER